jgi:hypothetical protein
MSCGQGLPLFQPDGQLPRAGLGDEEDDNDDNDVDDDSPLSYSERWVLGSGTPGSFGLADWGS